MLEYLGLELPWVLCRSYEELALEPEHSFSLSARSSCALYYLQGRNIWYQNFMTYYVTGICHSQPLALRWNRGVLHVLLVDGLRYYLHSQRTLDGDLYDLLPLGSAFEDLSFFYQ